MVEDKTSQIDKCPFLVPDTLAIVFNKIGLGINNFQTIKNSNLFEETGCYFYPFPTEDSHFKSQILREWF